MTKLETMHILQAQLCGCICTYAGLPYQRTKPETSDALKSQLNKARWNRKVLKFGSENQLNADNCLSRFFVIFTCSHDLENGHVTINLIVCAPRTLVLKNVRITGIWIRKNYCWQKIKFLKIKSMQHVLATLQ